MKMKKVLGAAAALSLAVTLSVSAYAAPPVALPSPDSATVSEETTRADNVNPSGTNTQFFLYIEPPVEAHDVPKTGDAGPDMLPLMGSAILSGIAYLVCNAYAERNR